MSIQLPFDESRRLTGRNLYFDRPGTALETGCGMPLDAGLLHAWRERIDVARAALSWPDAETVMRRHRSGASLAFAAPFDQLYTAAEANEWAWLASLQDQRPEVELPALHAPGHAAPWDQVSALRTLQAMAAEERNPELMALLHMAKARGLPAHADDDLLSIGEGAGSRIWPVRELPDSGQVPWQDLHAIPLAVVTGSNGKTTTVRLLAAMLRAQGSVTGSSSTDGVVVDGRVIDGGDYSGPMGARMLLRDHDVQAAVLETARGGILRRGLADVQARAVVITNISPDHFGEYGIHGLDDLADVKLTVVGALADDGLLVLNADDALLRERGATMPRRIGWFALDDAHPSLQAHRECVGATCAVRGGRLRMSVGGVAHDLGAISAMPVTLGGLAAYNIANAAAAALAAMGLGVEARRIAEVLARFGTRPGDNPGRLQRWTFGEASSALHVYLDYAHNPDGLRALLQVAGAMRGGGRVGLILGQAGNREDADIRALAAVAADFRPDRVWLKDIAGDYMRGRGSGEIAGILGDELQRRGVPAAALVVCLEEATAVRETLRWGRPGDVLVLPIHAADARESSVALLDHLAAAGWRAGAALPAPDTIST